MIYMNDFATTAESPPKVTRPKHRKPGPKQKAGIETWLTRHEAADMMRVSVFMIDKFTREGELKPAKRVVQTTRGMREVWVYNPRELVAIETKRSHMSSGVFTDPGVVAAKAFEMFQRGAALHDVVMGCFVPLSSARELHEQWLDAGGADLVINKAVHQMIEAQVGPFATVGDLAKTIDGALDRAYAAGVAQGTKQGIEHAKHMREIEVQIRPASPLSHASDMQVEYAIVAALDAAGASADTECVEVE